jgi:type IV secretory pathway VirB2 component (pilin)
MVQGRFETVDFPDYSSLSNDFPSQPTTCRSNVPLKRKISVVEHRTLPHGDFAYYDPKTDRIHILTKDAMYNRILRHEKAHAQWSFWARATDNLQNVISAPFGRMVMVITMIAFFGYVLFSRLEPLIGPSLVLGFIFSIVFLYLTSQLFYWAEEFRAEQVAKRQKPHRHEPKIREPVTRVPNASVTVQRDVPDGRIEGSERQLEQGSEQKPIEPVKS